MRMLLAGVLVVALVATVVSPAVGGPSIASVTETAKNALKTAKQAKRSTATVRRKLGRVKSAASSARSTATRALQNAGTANTKADQALARPVVTVQGITVVTQTAAIPPGSFNSVAAVCPPGQRVISGGAVTTSDQGGNWLNAASEDRLAWLAGGEDIGGGLDSKVTAEAYCAPAGQAVASGNAHARVRQQLQRLERAKARAAR